MISKIIYQTMELILMLIETISVIENDITNLCNSFQSGIYEP